MRDEIARLKRERILEEARQLFFEQGYQGTTLDQVARRLDVTKPFIYSHFDNKAALLGDIAEQGTRQSLKAVADAHDRSGDPAERLSSAIREFSHVVMNHQANIAVYFREDKYVPPVASKRIDEMRSEFDEKLSALIEEGVAKGMFQTGDVRLATLAIGGMISWMFTWYRTGGRLSDDHIADQMTELAMRMLGAEDVAARNANAAG
ncbi:MAG: TetR/AcrR family transcriptional regulator [Minwuia sp.]|nr:TetR/AcrR family transcriptional regulator [Minwuia sp.]